MYRHPCYSLSLYTNSFIFYVRPSKGLLLPVSRVDVQVCCVSSTLTLQTCCCRCLWVRSLLCDHHLAQLAL